MTKLKIGIIFDFSRKWMGGIYYYKSLIRSFSYITENEQPNIVLFYTKEFETFLEDLEYNKLEKVLLEEPLQKDIPKRFLKSILTNKNLFFQSLLDRYELNGVYAVNDYPVRLTPNSKVIVSAWIPDLQHDFFPQFFDIRRRIFRKIRLKFMIKNASNLIVSSNDVKKNFYEAFSIPDSLRIHTVRFSSINPPQEFDKSVLKKYDINEPYFIVCNQFLQHKNHIVVLEALKKAIGLNARLFIVITGNTKAYRQDNYFDELNDFIKDNNLEKNVIVTGLIPRDEQLTLIKFSEALIQPSKFEGWSTSIEDAKSLDIPVIASKLDVHYEQLGEEGLYFQQDDFGRLASILMDFKKSKNFSYQVNYIEHIKQFAYDFLKVFTGYYKPSPKILHLNASIGEGSTGRIFKKISDIAFTNGYVSFMAFGRWKSKTINKNYYYIGNKLNLYFHGLYSLLLDKHGFGSYFATLFLIRHIRKINPNIIQIHSLHGYYINIQLLFKFLKSNPQIKVVWTQHDCWSFTGHCAHYEDIACDKFVTQCYECPKTIKYPKSIYLDNSKQNYLNKKSILTGHPNLKLVAPSNWLLQQYKRSFLKEYECIRIYNGIDLEVFRPYKNFELSVIQNNISEFSKVILGVSNAWSKAKGLNDFYKLAELLGEKYTIVLIGIDKNEEVSSPKNVLLLPKTENIQELAKWYSRADVFVNPTYLDTFPTTNLEALACGTPVITYNSGGSPESIDEFTGCTINKGDISLLGRAVIEFCQKDRTEISKLCRLRAEKCFSQEIQFLKYIELFKKLTSNE